MKTAIIHDTLIEFGGAERVLFSLVKLFPKADIYLSLVNKDLISDLKKQTQGKIIVSPLSLLPKKELYSSWLKPSIYLYWELLNLKKYSLVISSSHSFNSKAVKTLPKTLHISYIYTPPRFLYSEFNKTGLITRSKISFLFSPFLTIMKAWDFKSAQRPDEIIAISNIVKKRIAKYYHRDSQVIYPPIRSIPYFKKEKGVYYVCLSRLAKQKGISLAIKTCNELQRKLIVIGTGPEEKKLKKIAGSTIEFKGFLNDKEVSQILKKAKAILYPSLEEDFGLSPIEALAHGVPIIAYNSGATPEYVIPNKTGLLFNKHSAESLKKAIIKFENKKWSAQACQKFSKNFNEKRFHQQILKLIKSYQD